MANTGIITGACKAKDLVQAITAAWHNATKPLMVDATKLGKN